MGIAFASEAMSRGADVTLVLGPTPVPPPRCRVVRVETTEEMMEAVLGELKPSDYGLLVMASAPLDFAFSKKRSEKISSDSSLTVSLAPLPKVVKEARKASPGLFIIGFKAEHDIAPEELEKRATERLSDSGMDMIIANDLSHLGAGFESETNEVTIITKAGKKTCLQKMPKRSVAKAILDQYLAGRGK
jgi:phosphopantothenoylcysteine decarboxylase/phosphopantothenate--cysteine ligase